MVHNAMLQDMMKATHIKLHRSVCAILILSKLTLWQTHVVLSLRLQPTCIPDM